MADGLGLLAWRNFARHLGRYRVVLLALCTSVVAVVALTALVGGAVESLRTKGSRYFAGDVVVQSYTQWGAPFVQDFAVVETAIAAVESSLTSTAVRSIYYGLDAGAYYDGLLTRLRRIAGVDWQREAAMFESMNFVDGGLNTDLPQAEPSESPLLDAAVISGITARALNARAGDRIIVAITTARGRRNTIELTVAGVYSESSFFGHTLFMDRRVFNLAMEQDEDHITDVGLHLQPRANPRRVAELVQQELALTQPVFPVISSRSQRDQAIGEPFEGRRYMVLTLDALMSEITDLMNALILIAAALILVFLSIAVVGVSNTYGMIVHERRNEIGTLRALGLRRSSTVRLFLTEAAILGATAMIIGSLIAFFIIQIIHHYLDLSGSAWAALFLTQGRVSFQLLPEHLGLIALAIIGSSLAGCARAAISAARLAPVVALSAE